MANTDGKPYGEALYALAKEENLVDGILYEIKTVADILKSNPDYVKVVDSPALTQEERAESVKKAFSETSEYVQNLLCILAEKCMLSVFTASANEFERLYNADNGILNVTALTAVPLTDSQKAALEAKVIKAVPGTKLVKIDNVIKPEILGGLVLRYDGKQYDASIALQLDSLQKKITAAGV